MEECILHSGEYIGQMAMEAESVAAEVLEKRPSAVKDFNDRADMIQCIQEALDSIGHECGICAHQTD